MKYDMREKSGSQIVACSYLKSVCKDDRAELFSVGADENFRDKTTSCKMATKRPFFTSRIMQHGNRLLQVSCGISVLRVFESQPRKCSTWLELLLVRQEAGLKTSQKSLPTFPWDSKWAVQNIVMHIKKQNLFQPLCILSLNGFPGKL